MKHTHIHAILLGSSFLLSLAIVLTKISYASRDDGGSGSAGGAAPKAAVVEAAPVEEAPDPFEEATRLTGMAEDLYRSSALNEERVDELGAVQGLLDKASSQLDQVVEDDSRVRELRLRLAQLRQDVARASGF